MSLFSYFLNGGTGNYCDCSECLGDSGPAVEPDCDCPDCMPSAIESGCDCPDCVGQGNGAALVPYTFDGEIVDEHDCEIGTSACTNEDVELREDPYESDVNGNPGQMVWACPGCYQERIWTI